MLESITTLEKARNYDWKTIVPRQNGEPAINIGSYDYQRPDSEQSVNFKEVLTYIMGEMADVKLVPWKMIKPKMDSGELMAWGQMHHNAVVYNRYLHEGWTEALRPDHPLNAGAMDFMNYKGEYQKISTVSDHEDCNELDDEENNQVDSVYYHAAKGHWLVNSIQKEGLRHPIQGHTNGKSLSIHPGSIRSKCFEVMDEPEFMCIVTDYENVFDCPPVTADELLNYWGELSDNKGSLSGIWVSEGKIEFSLSTVAGTDFRKEVFAFNKKVTQACNHKPVNIYLGYDSNHSELFDVAECSIHQSIESAKSGGVASEYFNDYKVEVKKLDISLIEEYNREYANQSTEFTYSRFLIPYLENYEGFSFFMDDDYIWKHNPLGLFYFIDPDHAVACVQYDFKHHDETKFNGEKNVSYPKKLWSSMMIFNNGHEDCRKLTPEAVNTWTGQQLHQFEWTDKISKIPHDKICTEGYEESFNNSHHAIHYTRGGPWIKDMDCSHINMLETYEKYKSKLPKSN